MPISIDAAPRAIPMHARTTSSDLSDNAGNLTTGSPLLFLDRFNSALYQTTNNKTKMDDRITQYIPNGTWGLVSLSENHELTKGRPITLGPSKEDPSHSDRIRRGMSPYFF
jgi:hypothetical protein